MNIVLLHVIGIAPVRRHPLVHEHLQQMAGAYGFFGWEGNLLKK